MSVGCSVSAVTAGAVGLLAVARASDQVVLAHYADKGVTLAEMRLYEAAIGLLLQKATELPACPGWKDQLAVGDELDDTNGHVHALADKQAFCVVFVAIRREGYPDARVQGLLQELSERLRAPESDDRLSAAKGWQLSGSLNLAMKELLHGYNDLSKLARGTAVHGTAGLINGMLHENIQNTHSMSESTFSSPTPPTHSTSTPAPTQSSASSLPSVPPPQEPPSTSAPAGQIHGPPVTSASAGHFLKGSVSLKREVQIRNLRVKATFAFFATAFAAYLLLPVLD